MRDGATVFCGQCGAPQLYLQDFEQAGLEAEAGTGAPPPPNPRAVDWKMAIGCAAVVGAVGGALMLLGFVAPRLSVVGELWILSGSVTTLTLYQRRRPAAWIDSGVGARIGVVVGLLMLAWIGVVTAVSGLVARFGLHRLGTMDAELARQIHVVQERAAANVPPPPAEILRFFASPEFLVGAMVAGMAMFAVFVMLVCVLGGAVGGMVRARRVGSA